MVFYYFFSQFIAGACRYKWLVHLKYLAFLIDLLGAVMFAMFYFEVIFCLSELHVASTSGH